MEEIKEIKEMFIRGEVLMYKGRDLMIKADQLAKTYESEITTFKDINIGDLFYLENSSPYKVTGFIVDMESKTQMLKVKAELIGYSRKTSFINIDRVQVDNSLRDEITESENKKLLKVNKFKSFMKENDISQGEILEVMMILAKEN